MPKIQKDVKGYGMTGNNFVSYSFLLFITLFSEPYSLLCDAEFSGGPLTTRQPAE